jgi:hypothetical protein
MRPEKLVIAMAMAMVGCACGAKARGPVSRTNSLALTPAPLYKPLTQVDFAIQIKPILQARCQPCHFSGGKVYDRMPFDRPETIRTLGTRLFTRIKDEKEQQLIRDFLAQH